ncbi:MAG TPA: hypothetical protein VGR43_06725 [Dehalococcoidia bacterium]|nr:hypothetical protein [Dehalococcoidia bacterium]
MPPSIPEPMFFHWRVLRPVGLMLIFLTMSAATALAQSRGTVIADQATIWRADATVVLAVVKAGTELEITGRTDRWYEVILPAGLGGRGERGLIAISQVKLLAGSPQPPPTTLRSVPAPSAISDRPGAQPRASVRGFGQIGRMSFTAEHSFKTILGQSYGRTFGGGVQVKSFNGIYLQLGVERFRETGQRVFVVDNTVYPLGIPDTITITPITLSFGYRFRGGSIVPYGGGGVGAYLLKEKSQFEAEGESVDEHHKSYHVVGGLELQTIPWVALAVEGQYTRVPDALGSNGVSAVFNEHDLGGFQAQLKVLIGK